MGLFQSLADAFDKKVDTAKTSVVDAGSLLSSGRFIALVALVALVVFKVCEPTMLTTLLWAFGIYTAGNTITRATQIVMDGLIHKAAVTTTAAPPAPKP